MKKWFCLMLLIGLSACGSADKVFLGYWKAQGNQFGYLHITQNGSGHLITIYDNSLTMDEPMGKVTGVYKEADQTLILNGKRVYQQVSSGGKAALLQPSPLRTGLASFPASGSSLHKLTMISEPTTSVI